MCTYNGAQYLQEQLNSIVAQNRLPDELVVCDDCSTDSTLQILERFQKTAPFSVRIYRNETNLGPTKNFEKVISLCKGDIIALSDQDDVWMPLKLERLERALENHPKAGYVFSDALVVDEKLRPLGYTMWNRVSFTARQCRRFEQGYQLEVLLKRNVVTGATMAFLAELRDLILPIPVHWIHDAWIALLASAAGFNGAFVKEPLIKYRQHSNNVIGGKKVNFHEKIQRTVLIDKKAQIVEASELFTQALDRLISKGKADDIARKLINAKIKHLRTRETLLKSATMKNIKTIFRELLYGNYHKFSNGFKSAFKDLLTTIK